MATLTISLPDNQKAFIDSEVAAGAYPDVDALFGDMVEMLKRHREDAGLAHQLLMEIAEAKGDVTEEDHERVRRQVEARRLAELRADLQAGIDEADRGEFIEYDSPEKLVEEVVREGRQLLAERRAGKQ
jgi:Arc/MetJ-type ribon-helix-helix transcriptional regulator